MNQTSLFWGELTQKNSNPFYRCNGKLTNELAETATKKTKFTDRNMAKEKLDNIDLSEYPYINKGLEGIVAFSTTKSFIDGQKGELIYAGYNIDTLAENATFEEVCFLLWNDRLPKQDELKTLKKEINRSAKITPACY